MWLSSGRSGSSSVPGSSVHVGVAGLQACRPRRRSRARRGRARRVGIRHAQHDVIDVVSTPSSAWRRARRPRPCRALELDATRPRPLDREVGGKRGQRLVEIEHAQADASSTPGSRSALGREERELPAAGVAPDEREVVGALDHVHAERGRRGSPRACRGRRPRGRRGRASRSSYRASYPRVRVATPAKRGNSL